MTKSIYLSTGRYAGADEQSDWCSELIRLQRLLKSGQNIIYDEADLARIAATKNVLRFAPPSVAWRAVVEFFMPGAIIIVVVWLVIWLIRALHL